MWAPSPVSPDHLLDTCQMTQPFGTHFLFSRNVPRRCVHLLAFTFFGDLDPVHSEKRGPLNIPISHSFYATFPTTNPPNHLSLHRDFCFPFKLSSFFPFPAPSPSSLPSPHPSFPPSFLSSSFLSFQVSLANPGICIVKLSANSAEQSALRAAAPHEGDKMNKGGSTRQENEAAFGGRAMGPAGGKKQENMLTLRGHLQCRAPRPDRHLFLNRSH